MQPINNENGPIQTNNRTKKSSILGVDRKFRSQTLPGDILALIVEELSSHPKELFAPLICSRVCSHWRNEIFRTPFLWSFIDTSRGLKLTELWLTNSRQSFLDIRLCDPPLQKRHLEDMQSRSPPSPSLERLADLIPESLESQIPRWKSLDVSLSCTCRVSKVLEFLGQRVETIYLDNLNIGPMGKTSLVLDDVSTGASNNDAFPTLPPLADLHLAPPHFRKINVQPVRLRIDTYPLWHNVHIFSPRLTVLEVFLGAYLAYDPDHIEWHTILSSTPNLVELSLWDPHYGARRDTELPKEQKPAELRTLRTLKLSGRFIHVTELLAASPLPSLRYLLLDSIDTTIAVLPMHLSRIALVSPELSHVSIGSMPHIFKNVNARGWAKAFRTLRTSLRELTFVEMEWLEIALALDQLSKRPHALSHLRIEGVWDMEPYDWTQLQSPGREMPTVEHISSGYGGASWCKSRTSSASSWGSSCRSEATSNYSENSSFAYTEGSPPSEELDSDKSEVSFDSDTDSLLIEVRDAEEERMLALAICLTPEIELVDA
ncbi:hypothetical protein BDV93DRAFT_528133 [Ceratobasidium sp. AG-I]|nr:hypothetical protein BDV93DRAFT_528133 [Ceratobasidium sp. AG-I]